MTQFYIACKQVEAWRDDKLALQPGAPKREGYFIKYSTGEVEWMPRNLFEAAYLPMGDDNDGSIVTQQMVDDFIVESRSEKMGDCTTVVWAKFKNGFEVAESSACVDPKNYHHSTGFNLAYKKIERRAWDVLGSLLQSARFGFTAEYVEPSLTSRVSERDHAS